MAIATQTVYHDWESLTVKFQRREGERRVKITMQHVDAMTGETTWHYATIENAGMYPEDDKQRFLYELRTLYLIVYKSEFGEDNPRPSPETFNTDPKYAWIREIEMPDSIFY